ncbi:MAG: LPP20 family lipoprotein, partial [Campylobacterota bacterium]|nr:LPP20 family lipoprotein [Campylobacterota bacterium]
LTISAIASPPKWYIENNIPFKAYENIGYGVGASKVEAKQNAKADISNSLQTTIKSSFIINKNYSNDSYSKSVNRNVEEISNVELDNLIQIKSEYIDNIYYVAIKYINLPFAKKVRLKFDDVSVLKKETNSYILNTLLLKELKDEFGFYPKITINKGNLTIGNQSFNINKNILKKLFSSNTNSNLKLQLPKQLKHQEYYFINLKSKKSGYVTLIQIYENGETSILFSNKTVNNSTQLEYPNKNEYDGLEAYLNDNQTKAKDLTIAMICKEKKDFSYFDNISVYKEKHAKVYGKIFDMMNGCNVGSKIIEIRR